MNPRGFWKNFLTGLIVAFPALVTLGILQLMFGWIFASFIDPVAKFVAFLMDMPSTTFLVRVVVAACFVVGLAAIGFGTRVLVLRRLFALGEELFRRVPMFGKIYGTMREIANTFSGDRRSLFNRAVLVEWPRPGVYSLGFVTSDAKGETQEKTPEHVVNVFIATTPNPTSGFLVLVPEESLIPLDMSVEEAMRLVISGGMSGPSVKKPKLPTP
ncbi:MAG: DUF502 domain-containing protein [Candidatus Omnitrophica bacterium]|nr:DUF502 domain-containing protein [Candidatus Omnitrophota bacterium]